MIAEKKEASLASFKLILVAGTPSNQLSLTSGKLFFFRDASCSRKKGQAFFRIRKIPTFRAHYFSFSTETDAVGMVVACYYNRGEAAAATISFRLAYLSSPLLYLKLFLREVTK